MRGMQVTAGQCNSSHTHPSKLLSCFWEQRPSEGSAGHFPMPSPSYCFLLLGWQGNRTPANLISICFIWSLAYFICQLAYPNYYWALGRGHSKLCQEKSKCAHSSQWLQWSLRCCSLPLPHVFYQPVQAGTPFTAALLNDSLKAPANSSLKQLLHAQTPATSVGRTLLSPALNLQARLLFLYHCHGVSHLFMSYNQHKNGP